MSDLYKADASNFTREQLVELINIQTNLQLEANKTIVIAKGKIEELEHKLAMAKEALESIAKNTCCTPCQEAKKVAEKGTGAAQMKWQICEHCGYLNGDSRIFCFICLKRLK